MINMASIGDVPEEELSSIALQLMPPSITLLSKIIVRHV
jgi:hypothetical protein